MSRSVRSVVSGMSVRIGGNARTHAVPGDMDAAVLSNSELSAANVIEALLIVAIVSRAGVTVISLATRVTCVNSVNEKVSMWIVKRPGVVALPKSNVPTAPVTVPVQTTRRPSTPQGMRSKLR